MKFTTSHFTSRRVTIYLATQLLFLKECPLKIAYLHYFGFSMGNQDKNWVSHALYESCRITLIRWASGGNVYPLCPGMSNISSQDIENLYVEDYSDDDFVITMMETYVKAKCGI